MEVPNIPIKPTVSKTGSGAVDASRDASKAYGKNLRESKDTLNISSEARLLQKLKSAYSKLEEQKSQEKAAEVKERLTLGTLQMSPEEVVNGILQGTLFEI